MRSRSIRWCSCTRIGGAHSDLLVEAVVLAGVLAVVGGRERTGAAAGAAAAALKASAIVALPFLVAGSQRPRRPAAAALGRGAALAAFAVALFGAPLLNLVDALAGQQEQVAVHSMPFQVTLIAGSEQLPAWGRLVAGALMLAAVIALLVRVRRGGDRLAGTDWAYIAILMTTAWTAAVVHRVGRTVRRAGGRPPPAGRATWALTPLFVVVRLPMLG